MLLQELCVYRKLIILSLIALLTSCGGAESGTDLVFDIDGDGVQDSQDAFPQDASETTDTDSDGTGNNADTDDDNDGVLDSDDAFPLDETEALDMDGDGIGNNSDGDIDGDSIPNSSDDDNDNDGVENDNDAFPLDASETLDTDGDEIGNNIDTDDDNDGILDVDDSDPLMVNNSAPAAIAGSDQTVTSGDSVNLSGSGSDNDGTIANYDWSQVSGTIVSITGAASASANFTAPSISSNEALTFTLTVTDDDGDTGSDDIVITVEPNVVPNVSPTANAGTDQPVISGDTVNLSGSGSDTDGTITVYQWTQLSGATVTISGDTGQSPSFTAPTVSAIEVLTFRLTVTDNDGDSSNDTVLITVSPSGLQTFTNSLGMSFKQLPSGTFTMGSPETELSRLANETQHQVTLSESFYMQTTEVTQGQWVAVMGSNPSEFSICGNDCPVETVPISDIEQFILTLNNYGEGVYSLPTEAQWEYACRAGTETAFANGEITTAMGFDPNLEQISWYRENSGGTPQPVAQKNPNDWGLYDMHGNVYEWTSDWYASEYGGDAIDPTGPLSGTNRVVRGGGWAQYPESMRCAARVNSTPSGLLGGGLGFRLIRLPDSTANIPPTVSAGSDQSVDSAASVSITGTASDTDGAISSYQWTQLSGATLTLFDADTATLTFTVPAVSLSTTLTFRLTVTDDDGDSSSDDVSINVKGTQLASTLIMNGSILMGATNIDVGGTYYDVSFIGGFCEQVFSICDTSSFTFQSSADALLASDSLLEQVFNKSLGLSGDYEQIDSAPEVINGSNAPTTVFILTPFENIGSTTFVYAAANADNNNLDYTISGIAHSKGAGYDGFIKSISEHSWAIWTRQ